MSMTPDQIAHQIIDMGNLHHRITNALRVEHARIDVAVVALHRIQTAAEQMPSGEVERIAQLNFILQQARRAILTLQGEV